MEALNQSQCYNVTDQLLLYNMSAMLDCNLTTVTKDRQVSILPSLTTFLLGTVGNLLALIVVFRQNRLRTRTVFYIFVAGLFCNDLLSELTTWPVVLAVYMNNLKWVGGVHLCRYHAFIMIFFATGTPLMVCAMAIERFLGLQCTFFYQRTVTKTKAKIALACLWSSSFIFALLPLVGFGNYAKQYPGTWCFFNFHAEQPIDTVYAYLFATVHATVTILIIVMNIIVIVALLRARRTRYRLSMPLHRQNRRNMKKKKEVEIQMVILLIVLTLAYSISWTPLTIRILINQSVPIRDYRADLLAVRFATINQILDPWSYILFRKAFFGLLKSWIMQLFCPHRMAVENSVQVNNGVGSRRPSGVNMLPDSKRPSVCMFPNDSRRPSAVLPPGDRRISADAGSDEYEDPLILCFRRKRKRRNEAELAIIISAPLPNQEPQPQETEDSNRPLQLSSLHPPEEVAIS